MNASNLIRITAITLIGLTTILLSSCGGGGGDSNSGGDSPQMTVNPPGTPAGGETGRTHDPLTHCNDYVVIDAAGNVAFPSIDRVGIPSGSGSLHLRYDAYSVPDRFIVKAGNNTIIDTGYRGSTSYAVRLGASAAQTRIITSPGSGTQQAAKASGPTQAVVEVWAPLPGTAWELTLTWVCQGTTGPTPPPSTGDGDDTRSTANVVSLPLGGRLAEISPAGDIDYYRFTLSSRGVVTINTRGPTDTRGQLQSSSGSVLESDDDSGGDTNFEIVRTLNAGTYYVRVSGYSSSTTGGYSLWISASSNSGGGGGGGGVGRINFTFDDECNDGSGMQYRFHEQNSSGSLTGWVWPGGSRVYVEDPGDVLNVTINCRSSSHAICFGARPDRSGATNYWGADIDGDEGCSDCCPVCPTSGSRTYSRNLTCR